MPSGQPFRFETRIRFIDTDASGRIHYTAMFRYFESAEIEFMREIDLIYERGGYAFPRVHVECDFFLAMVHDDLIQIEVSLTQLGKSSMRFEFHTLKSGALAAKGAVVIVCMDKTTERATAIPAVLREKLAERLVAAPHAPQGHQL
ncbi:MAG: acyl-CoA thioesterase [Acidobacteriaceae bacterium]|nr:acyl-CoA thioesterase [Acidobacteriaceae bacterium]